MLRRCLDDGGDPTVGNIRGITVTGGIGTLIESNTIVNCKTAGPVNKNSADQEVPSDEILISGNYLGNVKAGIVFSNSTANGMASLAIIGNELDLWNDETNPSVPAIQAIQISGTQPFKRVILRGNLVRNYADTLYGIANQPQCIALLAPTLSGVLLEEDVCETIGQMAGFTLANCTAVDVEANSFRDCAVDYALTYSNCTTIQQFDNWDYSGALVLGKSGAVHVQELASLAEMWIPGF
jgi:hypothetical protein